MNIPPADDFYQLPPPLNLEAWQTNQCNDYDIEFLLDGITHGFQIIPPDSTCILTPEEMTNYRSATARDVRDNAEQQIHKEILLGSYMSTKEKPATVSTLGQSLNLTKCLVPLNWTRNSTHKSIFLSVTYLCISGGLWL